MYSKKHYYLYLRGLPEEGWGWKRSCGTLYKVPGGHVTHQTPNALIVINAFGVLMHHMTFRDLI
jgi:hypothetical protein